LKETFCGENSIEPVPWEAMSTSPFIFFSMTLRSICDSGAEMERLFQIPRKGTDRRLRSPCPRAQGSSRFATPYPPHLVLGVQEASVEMEAAGR